jgi:hypothetical protein
MDATLGQAAKPSEVVGSKSVRKSGGLSAVTGVANVEIMKMALMVHSSLSTSLDGLFDL